MHDRSPAATARDWAAEYARLSAADSPGMPPQDVERWALAAYLVRRDEESLTLRARAYDGYVGEGRAVEAVRCAFWLGFHLFNRGDWARAAGLRARVVGEFG